MAAIASCVEACLYTAGRGQMNNVQTARQRKAEWFYRDRESFYGSTCCGYTQVC